MAAEEALFCRTGEKRNQWAKWAYAAFNERRIAYGFNELKDGIVEHSACEFTRYLRESMRAHRQELFDYSSRPPPW